MSKLLMVLVVSVVLFLLLGGVYGVIALGAAFAASAACLRAARRGSRGDGVGTNPSAKPLSRAGLVVGALVMSPAFLLAALIVRPTPIERLTLRQTGIGSYLTNDAGERISGNRYTQTLHVGESASCHVRRLPLMGAVIESCTVPPRAGHR